MSDTLLKKLAKPILVAATVIWGTSFFIMKDTLNDVGVNFLLAFRSTVAALLLAVVFRRRWKGMDRSCWWRGGLMGLFLFIAHTVQNYGLMYTTPGKNAFFTAVYCVIVPFLYWAVDRKRPNRYNILAALLCIVGIGMVSWDSGLTLALGDGLTLISGFFFACHIVAVSKFSQGQDIFLLTVIQFASSALLCWAAALVTRQIPTQPLSPRVWLVLLYLAVFVTAVAFLFQNVGQKYSDPSSAAVLLSLEAPFGVFFSVVFTEESPTALMYLGFGVIFIAVLCSETRFSFLRKKALPQ